MGEQIAETGTSADIDVEKANLMLTRIIEMEKINVQTKQFSSSAMVEKIRRVIEEEVQCL